MEEKKQEQGKDITFRDQYEISLMPVSCKKIGMGEKSIHIECPGDPVLLNREGNDILYIKKKFTTCLESAVLTLPKAFLSHADAVIHIKEKT